MSSILEALNKVEEDRNASAASDSEDDAPFAPERAAEALLAQPKKKRSPRQSPPFNWKPLFYLSGGLACIVLITGLSAGVALLVGKSGHSAPAVAVAAKPADSAPLQAVGKETYSVPAPAPVASAIVPEPKTDNSAESAGTTPGETIPAPVEVKAKPAPKAVVQEPKAKTLPPVVVPPKPAPPVEVPVSAPVPAVEPVRVAEAVPEPVEEPTAPLPTEEDLARARAGSPVAEARETVPMRGSPVSLAPGRAAEKRAPLLEDINTLPRLGQNERERLGMGELRLNVLREASPSQPEGLAIINLKKVYVGEMIPGTNARLIAVQSRAIAIEIDGTGERFKVSN